MTQPIVYAQGQTPQEQIERQEFGVNGCRRAIAAAHRLTTYEDLCATHGVTQHLTQPGYEFAECAQCVAEKPDLTRAEARRVGHVSFPAICATHGRAPHSVAHGKCLTRYTSAGVERQAVTGRPPSEGPRAAARRLGESTYKGTCAEHGETDHSVTHGKCLTCFNTAGIRRPGRKPDRVTYQTRDYDPARVTGVYVRLQRKGLYIVNEAATGTGRWAGMAGHGPTLRSYETSGEAIPADVRERADTERTTVLWEYRTA